jgi:hypothetical protein
MTNDRANWSRQKLFSTVASNSGSIPTRKISNKCLANWFLFCEPKPAAKNSSAISDQFSPPFWHFAQTSKHAKFTAQTKYRAGLKQGARRLIFGILEARLNHEPWEFRTITHWVGSKFRPSLTKLFPLDRPAIRIKILSAQNTFLCSRIWCRCVARPDDYNSTDSS